MTNDKKAILLAGLLQITAEYTDDLMNDSTFGALYRQRLKKTCNNYLKELDSVLDVISESAGIDINEQLLNVNRVITENVEEIDLGL